MNLGKVKPNKKSRKRARLSEDLDDDDEVIVLSDSRVKVSWIQSSYLDEIFVSVANPNVNPYRTPRYREKG